jgi:hypothetical protein
MRLLQIFKTNDVEVSDLSFNEKELLQITIEHYRSKNSLTLELAKNIELLVWHDFVKNRSVYIQKYKGDAKYATYCLALFSRLVNAFIEIKTHMQSSA